MLFSSRSVVLLDKTVKKCMGAFDDRPCVSALDALQGISDSMTHTTGYLDQVPHWVDPGKIRRGQALYANVYFIYALVLLGALANGFIISRFSEVLVLSGYATDPRLAGRRFRDTGMRCSLGSACSPKS